MLSERRNSVLERFPKVRAVYAAYEQAGRELALNGRISTATQRKANQEIIPIPHCFQAKEWVK